MKGIGAADRDGERAKGLSATSSAEWAGWIGRLEHARPEVAQDIRRVLLAASAQEAALLGIDNRPLHASIAEIAGASNGYLGARSDEGALCGWISVEREPAAGGDPVIVSLVVEPTQQRRGIARRLLGAALGAVAPKALRVSTPALNAPALALYRRCGFVETGRASAGPAAIEIVLLRHAGSAACHDGARRPPPEP